MKDRKLCLFGLILMLAVCALFPALAGSDSLQISVLWTDGEGVSQSAFAVPVSYDGYQNSYWVQVPGDAMWNLTLQVQDAAGEYVSFNWPEGAVLDNVTDAGTSLENARPVEITGYDVYGQQGTPAYLYISTVTSYPEQPQIVIPDAEIQIRYRSGDLDVASATWKTLPAGVHTVYAEPYDLLPDYVLSGSGEATVVVDEYGANPSEVIFYYDYVKPYVAPVDICIHYADAETGAAVANDTWQTVEEGTHAVYAAPQDLTENYVLTGAESYQVTVNEYGADVSDVTFTYSYVKPYVAPVDICIHYVDAETGAAVANDTWQTVEEGTHAVYAAPQDLMENYVLTGAESYQVTVNEYGADISDVTFTYSYVKPYVAPVDICIHYVDAETGAAVANDTWQTVEEGTHAVYAAPQDLMENYVLTGAESYQVTVNEYGADVNDVTFAYTYVKPYVAPVDICIHYVDAETGAAVANDTWQTVEEGTHAVYAAPQDLTENYVLTGAESYSVTVDAYGADIGEVTFCYEYVKPQASPASVTVRYVDADNGLPVAMDETVDCPAGESTLILAQPRELLSGYTLTGEETALVTVDEDGIPDRNEVVFFYVMEQPQPTEAPAVIEPREVSVLYYSTDNIQVATPTAFLCLPGENTVPAEPWDLSPDYELADESSKIVVLDDNGLTPDTVIFYYRQAAAPTPAPVQVTIRFVNQEGEPIAPDQNQFFTSGDTPVVAPDTIEPDFILDGEGTFLVHVDENGANTREIVFTYHNAVPVPKIALVPVKYADQNGKVFYNYTETCQEGTENLIRVDWDFVLELGYGDYSADVESVTVTVDENGAANPAEVNFIFRRAEEPTAVPTEEPTPVPTEVPSIPPTEAPTPVPTEEATAVPVTPAPTEEAPVLIRVRYQTYDGVMVASSQDVMCYRGNNVVEARPADLMPGYLPDGSQSLSVMVDENGVAVPAEAVFYYVPTATDVPATATPLPYQIEAMDGYCYPNGDGKNFRSTPSTKEDNKISVVNRNDLARITGKTVVNGDLWYAVEIDGERGFLSGSVVRILSAEEIAALFGYTPVPTDTPAPTEPPIPDHQPIDRWGEANTKVNFRSEMSASAEKVKGLNQIAKGTRVWVLESDTVEDQKWYSLLVGGKAGYVMADYVDLYTQEKSDEIQSLLPSPVPTQGAPATATPAPVTESPVPETPVPTPEITPTPVPYRGYALTQWQVALRPGVSDEDVLEWLANDSLVYVSGQTYVDGEAYSSIQALDSGNCGFVVDRSLMPITNDEAKPYLDALRPAQATATPVPEQMAGFAMTMGDGVPLRAFADTNAEITQLLPYGVVASVISQTYTGDTCWHLIQYNGMWGYVRNDQMRMMSEDETIAYLQSQEEILVTPTPAPTPEPVTPDSLSSYGHVISTSGKVNLRAQPSTSSNRLRLLDNYAFALVYEKIQNNEGTWYHVSQAGTDGYINGDYFKVLSLSELSDFLQSSEYQAANSQNTDSGNPSSSKIQPVEDYNQTVWKNPALDASYEPFNPYPATPTPDPEQLYTEAPETTAPAETPTAAPVIAPVSGLTTPEPATKTGGSPWPWVLVGLAAVGGGGAYYAYTVYRKNERRKQAIRAQQMQKARQAQAAAQPQMRAAQNNPSQGSSPYTARNAAPFMPPQNAAPTAGKVPQTTNPYKPVSQKTGMYFPQNTQNYSAVQAPAVKTDSGNDPGATRAFNPNAVRPQSAQSQQTVVYRPAGQDTTASVNNASSASSSTSGYQRQRRSDRHKNDNNDL